MPLNKWQEASGEDCLAGMVSDRYWKLKALPIHFHFHFLILLLLIMTRIYHTLHLLKDFITRIALRPDGVLIYLIFAPFKNLIVELYVIYAFNTHVKFCVNWILFTIWLINLYFMHNFKLGQNLVTKLVVTLGYNLTQ